jgi:hypothetical protein
MADMNITWPGAVLVDAYGGKVDIVGGIQADDPAMAASGFRVVPVMSDGNVPVMRGAVAYVADFDDGIVNSELESVFTEVLGTKKVGRPAKVG